MKKYNLVVCGGTFDHFHKGHREFLRYALSISNKLLVGLTTNDYIKTKHSNDQVQSYKTRRESLEDFFYKENTKGKVWIEPIDDIYLPKVWKSLSIEAIVVTNDTISAAEKVNLRRIEQGKSSLIIKVFPSVKSSDNGYISSSRIRNGEINREGKPYINPLWFRRKLFITEKLRRDLKKAFGVLLRRRRSLRDDVFKRNVILVSVSASRIPKAFRDSGQDGYQTGQYHSARPSPEPTGSGTVTRQARMTSNSYLMTVGDITTKTFNKLGLEQDISVIDFKVARQIQFFNLKELGFSGKEKIIKIANPAGCLTPALFKTVSQIFKASRRISLILLIDGEEDLCVLPLTLGAPLGSVIFYGQPREGVVKVEVSEKSKEMAFDLVNQFRLIPSTTRGY